MQNFMRSDLRGLLPISANFGQTEAASPSSAVQCRAVPKTGADRDPFHDDCVGLLTERCRPVAEAQIGTRPVQMSLYITQSPMKL
jgi:hypothetical protein